MNIFKRVSNIISSKIDDLIAGYEDPEMALDALIQDMEKGIAELRTNAASCISQKKMTEKKKKKKRRGAIIDFPKSDNSPGRTNIDKQLHYQSLSCIIYAFLALLL